MNKRRRYKLKRRQRLKRLCPECSSGELGASVQCQSQRGHAGPHRNGPAMWAPVTFPMHFNS